jgi:hypothetical protein
LRIVDSDPDARLLFSISTAPLSFAQTESSAGAFLIPNTLAPFDAPLSLDSVFDASLGARNSPKRFLDFKRLIDEFLHFVLVSIYTRMMPAFVHAVYGSDNFYAHALLPDK